MRLDPKRTACVLVTLSLLLSGFGRRQWAAVSDDGRGAAGASCAAAPDKETEIARLSGAACETGGEQPEVTNLMLAFGVRRADVFTPESPRHAVTPEDFCLDRREMTDGQFKAPSLIRRLAGLGRIVRPGAVGRVEYVFTGLRSGRRAPAP